MLSRTMFTCCLASLLVLLLVGGFMLAEDVTVEPVPVNPIPIVKYVMASPRACLLGPGPCNVATRCLQRGAAENFRRANGAIRIPVGTRVIFCLSRELEGVWYPRSYGALGTSLVLQWCKACKTTDCDCIPCEPDEEVTDVEICPWVTIGRDGAKDVRRGPSIGRARVGVPVRFRKAGIYYMRGIVCTFAGPFYPRPVETSQETQIESTTCSIPPSAFDKDIIYVRVHVVNLPIDQIEPDEEAMDDPDVVNIKPMPKEQGTNQVDIELDDSDEVSWIELDAIDEDWGQDYEIPMDAIE
jgi:hypothetical protein